jgi:glutaredoxin 3
MSAELKLYVKSWCPWCITAKNFLNKRGYHYDEVDVNRDQAAYDEMIRISGQTYTPTLVADGRVLADFGPEELELFLKQHSIQP